MLSSSAWRKYAIVVKRRCLANCLQRTPGMRMAIGTIVYLVCGKWLRRTMCAIVNRFFNDYGASTFKSPDSSLATWRTTASKLAAVAGLKNPPCAIISHATKRGRMDLIFTVELVAVNSREQAESGIFASCANVENRDGKMKFHGALKYARNLLLPMAVNVLAAAKGIQSFLPSIISAAGRSLTIRGPGERARIFMPSSKNLAGQKMAIAYCV
jgi:hypothetical protein